MTKKLMNLAIIGLMVLTSADLSVATNPQEDLDDSQQKSSLLSHLSDESSMMLVGTTLIEKVFLDTTSPEDFDKGLAAIVLYLEKVTPKNQESKQEKSKQSD